MKRKKSFLSIWGFCFLIAIATTGCDLGSGAASGAGDSFTDGGSRGELPLNKTEGNAIHITQIVDATYNPGGPSTSNNCGPASLAMCLRGLGYFGYRSAAALTPEEQVDHSRAVLYPAQTYNLTSIVREGITYQLLNNDGAKTDIETNLPNAMSIIGGSTMTVNSQALLDKALGNGLPVILGGNLTTTWKAQFVPSGHWGGSGYHYIAVTGRTSSGTYVVNDPLYRYGAVLMSYSQLLTFYNSTLNGIGVFWQTPTPFALKKASNSRAYAFMRRTSDKLIYKCMQYSANGAWSTWSAISTIQTIGNPVVVEQPNGLLVLFTRGTSGQILKFAEDAYGGMSSCVNFEGETWYPLSAARNSDGRIEVHARGTDGNLYRRIQSVVNGEFAGWEKVIEKARTGSSACRNRYGIIELSAGIDATPDSTNLGRTWQTAAGGAWNTTWQNLQGHLKYSPVLAAAPDLALYSFVRSVSEDILYYKFETDGWNRWANPGTSNIVVTGQPAVGQMASVDVDGYLYSDLSVFVRARSNVINWTNLKKRNNAYSWTAWNGNIGGIATSDPAVARYSDGRIFVVVRGTTGYMYIRLQNGTSQSWIDWQSLGDNLVF